MKLAKTLNRNYLWLLLGSYFVAMMVNLLSFSTKELFLELGKVGWTHTVLALFISYPILWFLTESKKYICIQKLNLWFAAGILFISILKNSLISETLLFLVTSILSIGL